MTRVQWFTGECLRALGRFGPPAPAAARRPVIPRGRTRWLVGVVSLGLVASFGCAVTFSKRSPWDIQRLEELSEELEHFKTLAQLQQGEADQLRQAKRLLEGQVGSSEVSVGYDERGLVTRFLDRVLFDSGKAKLRFNAYPVLDRVAEVLKGLPTQPVGIEGHTDNEPIRVSGWADNKALSMARANVVADYLASKHQIDRRRFTVIGYGEERPISTNDTAGSRQKNRRVEIVILPQSLEHSYKAEADRMSKDSTRFSK